MGARKVPVIRIDGETGEKTRYPSILEAARSIKASTAQISIAILSGKQCHGCYWIREDEMNEYSKM